MPYCYLITAYTAKCNHFIKSGDMELAYEASTNAVDTASEMFAWVNKHTTDQQVIEDYKFFKGNVPYWAYRFSNQFESDDNKFTSDERYKMVIEEMH